MDIQHELFRDSIRKKVCSVCSDCTLDGTCELHDTEVCAIERFLPEIIDTATSVKSDKIDDYVSALRASVCRACRPGGEIECSIRETSECALDRYFALIVEAIEEVVLKDRVHSVISN